MAAKAIGESALQLLTNAFADYGSLGAEAISSPLLFGRGFGNEEAAAEFSRLRESRREKLPTYEPSQDTVFAQEKITKPVGEFFSEKARMFSEENPNAAESIGDFFSDPRVAHTLGALELGFPSGGRAAKALKNRPAFDTPKQISSRPINKQSGHIKLFDNDPLKDAIYGGAIEEALWKRNASFDPRFDKRVGQQERLGNLETMFDVPRRQYPQKSIFDMEGEGFVTSQSDRNLERGNMLGINNVFFKDPVETTGGQFYPFRPHSQETGQAWSSGEVPVQDIINKARIVKQKTGKDPLIMPHTMTPSGGDFSKMNGEVMIKYASANMSPDMKKELNDAIRDYVTVGTVVKGKRKGHGKQIQGWKGVDDPASVEAWRNTPDSVRKELKNKIFDKFRDKGGLSQGETRLALADPEQLWTPDGQLNMVGRIFADKDMLMDSGNPTFPRGVRGQGEGQLIEPVESFDLLDQLYTTQGRKIDMQNPTRMDRRLLEMQSYGGIVTDKALRRVEDRRNKK